MKFKRTFLALSIISLVSISCGAKRIIPINEALANPGELTCEGPAYLKKDEWVIVGPDMRAKITLALELCSTKGYIEEWMPYFEDNITCEGYPEASLIKKRDLEKAVSLLKDCEALISSNRIKDNLKEYACQKWWYKPNCGTLGPIQLDKLPALCPSNHNTF